MPQNVYEDLLQKESLKNPYEELLQRREQESPTPTTPTAAIANPYEELLRRRDEADSVALKSSLQGAVGANPDAKARAARIADRLHVPVDVVERNPEMFQEQDAVESLPYDDLLRQTPKLADWLSTPQNAAVSNDDLSQLTAFDQTLRIGTNLVRAPVAGIFRGVTAGLWGTIEAGADLAGFTNVAAYAARVQEAALQNTAAIRGAQTGAGWFEQQVYGGIESVGMQAPGILASIVTGTAYPRLAQLGLEAVPALATIGLQTGGEAYAQARAYPGRPAPVLSPAAARAFAAGQGTVEVLTEMIPAERFLKDLGMNAGVLKTIAHQLVPEVVGEEIATLLQDLNEWAFLRPNAPFSQYLAERPSAAAATLISTIVAVGVQSAGGHATKRLIERLGATAAASSTVKRAPEAAENLVATETKDGPLETHYADFDTWVTYWQSKGIDPAAAAATVSDNPQAFDPTTKAPIPISTAKWTVRMGPTEHNAFWANELREEPNKPNGREQTEADAFVAAQAAQTQPIATAAGTSTEQLQQRIQTELEGVGWEPSIAADKAKQMAEGFGAFAAELRTLGVQTDALTLYEGERIQWAREGLTAPAVPTVEAGVPRETPPPGGPTEAAHVPFMITRQMEADLQARGYDAAAINAMTPAQAHQALTAGAVAPITEAPGARATPATEADAQAIPVAGGPAVPGAAAAAPTPTPAAAAEPAAPVEPYGAGPPSESVNRPGDARLGSVADSRPSAAENEPGRLRRRAGESDEQLAERRAASVEAAATERKQSHYADLFAHVAAKAQQLDPNVDLESLHQQFADRVAMREEALAYERESGHDPLDLMRAIAQLGGIRAESYGGLAGERRRLMEDTVAGRVKGIQVFTKDGLAFDEMVTALGEDQRFKWLETPERLIRILDDFLRNPPEDKTATLPGSAALRKELGIDTSRVWWRIPEAMTGEEGDTSFDVTEFGQPLKGQPPTEDVLPTGEVQPRLTGAEAVREQNIPTPQLEAPFALTPPSGEAAGRRAKQTTLFQTRRAAITFGPEGVRIEFFKDADLTSFEHELSHLYMNLMQRLAKQYPNSRFATDLTLLTDWFGTTDIGPKQHEQLAEGFETYMEEGIAPSAELRPVFARIRAWFLLAYKQLRRANVPLTDQVRGVFDRWQATAEAIAAAQAEGRVLPFFRDATEMGVPEEQFQAYLEDAQRLSADAHTQLQKEAAKETAREQSKRYQAQRKQVQADVRAELLKHRAFRVRAAVQRGTNPDGSPLVEGQEPEPLKGQPPEVVAELFGFTSADEMNQALRAIKGVTLNAAIRQEAARRMEALQGPQLVADPVQLADAAQDAVYSEGRAALIAQELAALTKLAQQQREQREQTREARPAVAQFQAAIPKPAALKVAAEARVRQVRVRDLRPGLYLSAMQRASRMATEAALKRNIPAAIQAKQEELFSLAMYRATRDAKAAADAVVPWVRKHDTKTSRARIGKAGESNIDQWDALLHQYEFKNTTQKVLDRRASLRNWMESQQALGLGIDLPTSVLNQTQRVNYRELTVEELSGVNDAMRQLIHFSYKKFDLLEAKEKRELEKKSTAVAERVVTTSKGRTSAARLTRSRGMLDSVKKWGNDVASSLLNPDTILRELDGWEDLGPVYTHLKGGIDRSIVEQLLPRLRAAAEAIGKLNAVYKPGELQKKVFIQSLRDSMTKEEVITVMLNWGSPENRAALLESKLFADLGANEATVQDILSHADERDWNYVQSVWDYYQTFWPEIAESQRRRKGIIPNKVEATSIVTPFGTKRGGYHPLKYEREGSIPATEDDISDTLQQMQLGRFSSMFTRDGFAKERVGSGGRTVLLSLGVIGQHVNEVIYDLSLGDAIQNTDRIMRTSVVREAFEKGGHTDAYMALRLWLRDVATGEVVAADRLSKSLRFIRAGGTGAALLANISSVLVQPIGIAQTFAALNKRDAAGGVMDMFTRKWWGPKSLFAQVVDASPFMATRQTTFNKDISNAMARIQDSRYIPAWVGKAGFYLMTKSQWILDVATWLGAHRQGLRQFQGDTKKAVAFADRMVGRIGASGLLSDRSGFERGTIGTHSTQSEFVKMWTMLGSYMFAKGNLWYEKTRKTNFKNPAQVLGYMVDMVLLFTVESLAIAWMRGMLPGDDDDDDSWTWWLLKESAKSMAGTLPIVREFASELEGFRAGGPIGDLGRKMGEAYGQAAQGEFDKALVKSLNNLTGVFVHGYPSVAINRFIEAETRREEGEDVSLIDYFVTRKKAQ